MELPPRHLARIAPNMWTVNLMAIPLALVCAAGFVLFALALPHHPPVSQLFILWFLLGIGVALSLHELTHAFTAMWRAKLPWSAFRFGFNPKMLIFYCHCRRPISLADYRLVSLAPLVILGPLSVLLVVIYPAEWLALTAGIHLSACIGDAWIFTLLRKYAPDVLVVDHPTEAGCDLYERAPAAAQMNDVVQK